MRGEARLIGPGLLDPGAADIEFRTGLRDARDGVKIPIVEFKTC